MSRQTDAWDRLDEYLDDTDYDWEVTHDPDDADDRLGLRITDDFSKVTIHVSITPSGDIVPTWVESDYSDTDTCEGELFHEVIRAVYETAALGFDRCLRYDESRKHSSEHNHENRKTMQEV